MNNWMNEDCSPMIMVNDVWCLLHDLNVEEASDMNPPTHQINISLLIMNLLTL